MAGWGLSYPCHSLYNLSTLSIDATPNRGAENPRQSSSRRSDPCTTEQSKNTRMGQEVGGVGRGREPAPEERTGTKKVTMTHKCSPGDPS